MASPTSQRPARCTTSSVAHRSQSVTSSGTHRTPPMRSPTKSALASSAAFSPIGRSVTERRIKAHTEVPLGVHLARWRLRRSRALVWVARGKRCAGRDASAYQCRDGARPTTSVAPAGSPRSFSGPEAPRSPRRYWTGACVCDQSFTPCDGVRTPRGRETHRRQRLRGPHRLPPP